VKLRHAVRALVFDPADRILLELREALDEGDAIWATPGGGIEAGESHEEALRRELVEEVGLDTFELGSAVWRREHLFAMLGGFDGQREHFYVVRVPVFEPAGTPDPDVTKRRWWALAELASSTERFAPRRLPELVAALLRDPPDPEEKPVDVGV